jgi:hypothetical protein
MSGGLVVGCQLVVAGCQFFVPGFSLVVMLVLITNNRQPTTKSYCLKNALPPAGCAKAKQFARPVGFTFVLRRNFRLSPLVFGHE